MNDATKRFREMRAEQMTDPSFAAGVERERSAMSAEERSRRLDEVLPMAVRRGWYDESEIAEVVGAGSGEVAAALDSGDLYSIALPGRERRVPLASLILWRWPELAAPIEFRELSAEEAEHVWSERGVGCDVLDETGLSDDELHQKAENDPAVIAFAAEVDEAAAELEHDGPQFREIDEFLADLHEDEDHD